LAESFEIFWRNKSFWDLNAAESIFLNIKEKDGKIVFEIQDKGIGIPARERKPRPCALAPSTEATASSSYQFTEEEANS